MRIAATADIHFSPSLHNVLHDQLSRVRDDADVLRDRHVREEADGCYSWSNAPGDTYAITVEGVGTLTNPCVAEDYQQ